MTQVTARCLIVVFLLSLLPAAPAIFGQSGTTRWITAWATSQQALGNDRLTNATVRLIARVTVPGDAVRIRLDNTFGTDPVTVGRAYVGHRVRGSLLAAGSNRPVVFNGKAEIVIPAGGTVWSDPVQLQVRARQDLAISLYIPGANVSPSQHSNAVVTSYRTEDGKGDVASAETAVPFTQTLTAMWWLKAIDVQSVSAPGVIVAFGDSITDGTCSTLDAHDRWEDVLSLRLGLQAPPTFKAVINEGIGGNTLMREGLAEPPGSTPGLERLDRDVLSHHGVTDVVLFMGTNDLRRGATAARVIDATRAIIQRVKSQGIRIVGVTIIPRHNAAPAQAGSGWDAEKTRFRNEVNQWIRTKAPFDRVIDFDAVVRDPANHDLILPPYNCGDGIHPSPLGYFEMGKSIDLNLFQQTRK
jgi:lysophospholipase L1-like esterase